MEKLHPIIDSHFIEYLDTKKQALYSVTVGKQFFVIGQVDSIIPTELILPNGSIWKTLTCNQQRELTTTGKLRLMSWNKYPIDIRKV